MVKTFNLNDPKNWAVKMTYTSPSPLKSGSWNGECWVFECQRVPDGYRITSFAHPLIPDGGTPC
jgi:hypothetical protein